MQLHEPAWAKVNLFLHVVGRRPDGYHLLDSLAVFPAIGDIVSATPAETISLTLYGPFGATLVAESDNLVLRAARALQTKYGVGQGACLSLEKNLPIASGIGGGSADAAATLRVLCRLWEVEPSLHDIAEGLGADVPVCLAQKPARMQGVGEILSASPTLPAAGMVLINPGIAVATPAVFRARTGGVREPAQLPPAWANAAEMARGLHTLHNDLQAPAISLCPEIGHVLAALEETPSCLLSRMSGSGATCFGLFATTQSARQAAATLARKGWWVWGGAMEAENATTPGLPDHTPRP